MFLYFPKNICVLKFNYRVRKKKTNEANKFSLQTMIKFLFIPKTDTIISEEHKACATIIEGNSRANSFLNAVVRQESKDKDWSKILRNVCN